MLWRLTVLLVQTDVDYCRGSYSARGQSHVAAWPHSMTQVQKVVALVAGLLVLAWLSGFSLMRHGSSHEGQARVIKLPDTAVENDFSPLFQQEQLALSSMQGILSFLETVESTQASLGRLQNQLQTLFAFFDLASLSEFILVTSDADAAAVRHTVQEVTNQHQRITTPDGIFRFLTYSQCSDQIDTNSRAYNGASTMSKQQLARLSCAQHIKSPFYANLETEVFFTRPSNALSFFKEASCSSYSAVCNSGRTLSYQAANDIYPVMDRDAEQRAVLLGSASLLRWQVAVDWRPAMGVMPQVFATEVSKQLGSYVQKKFKVASWQAFLLDQAHPDKLTHGRTLSQSILRSAAPVWDAYNVYWLFATRACVFENFHVPGSVLQASAVWTPELFHAWSPCTETFHQPPKLGVVSLVHPSTNVSPSSVWEKIQPCLVTDA